MDVGPRRRRVVTRWVAVLSSIAALCAGCVWAASAGGAGAGPAPRVERGEVDGQDAQAVLPPAGTAVRALVVYLHGVTETAAATTDDADVARLTQALARGGFVVVSSDADGDSFGSPAAQAVYLATAQAAATRYATHDTFLLAESMGGLSAIPLVASGKVPDLRGLVGISPAINLRSTSSEDFAAAVAKAWGHRPTAADSPLSLPAADFAGARMRFYLAAQDTVVPTDQNVLPFARKVWREADTTLVGCSGGHVDPSCFQPGDVLAYLDGLMGAGPPADPFAGLCRSDDCAVARPGGSLSAMAASSSP